MKWVDWKRSVACLVHRIFLTSQQLVKKYERGDLIKSDWLDKMAWRKMEEVHAAETAKSENLFLYIDLPRFDFPVIFSEPEAPTASTSALLPTVSQPPLPTSVSSAFTSEPHLWAIIDPDVARENPVEDKHRRLVRSHRSSPYDRELKPNAKIRDELGVRCCFSLFRTLYLTISTRKFSITLLVNRSPLRKRI
jgi:phosphatidylinositol 3-kinase